MDKRSWPWKKKSSDKTVAEKAAAASVSESTAAALSSAGNTVDQVCLSHLYICGIAFKKK